MKIPVVYWISSAAVAALGACIMAAGYVQMQNPTRGVSETYTESGIHSIHTELPRCALRLVASETEEDVTIALENAPSTVSVFSEDGMLYVTDAGWSNLHLFSFGETASQMGEIIITVPQKSYEDILLSVGFGAENFISGIQTDHLKIDNGAGDWTIKNTQAASLKMDNGAGKTDLQNCTLGALVYSQGAGDLTGMGVSVQSRTEIESGAGNCVFDVCEFAGKVNFDCGMGNLELNDLTLNGDMDIDCGAGNITIGILGDPDDYTVDCSGHVGNTSINGNTNSNVKYKITIDGFGNVDVDFHD